MAIHWGHSPTLARKGNMVLLRKLAPSSWPATRVPVVEGVAATGEGVGCQGRWRELLGLGPHRPEAPPLALKVTVEETGTAVHCA